MKCLVHPALTAITATHLFGIVSYVPENFDANGISQLLQLKPKVFLWMYTLFNRLPEISGQHFEGPGHHLYYSSFLLLQVIKKVLMADLKRKKELKQSKYALAFQ